ncbi:hypothetical protein [Leucobacter sp. M11]|uniref:hypothetical protein n=1 Tax=Leucobacter sp. M11 TaxID=2993565 RepID=UPI002D810077|nr:hypothetical protein [Leucobacter sp. M11]MEB4616382.1 hypothetical protein [Leucobacter sp. M11]
MSGEQAGGTFPAESGTADETVPEAGTTADADADADAGSAVATEPDALPGPDSANAPGPAPAEVPAEPSVREDRFVLDIVYMQDDVFLGTQQFSDLPAGSLIGQQHLELPEGFRLAQPFTDYTVFRNEMITIELVETDTPHPAFDITVRYLLDGREVGREVLAQLPELFVIHDEDLTVPAGYVQAHPMLPHVVTAAVTIDIEVIAEPAELVEIVVWFRHGDTVEGMQVYQQLPLGAVIREGTLVLPRGFRLREPFLDYPVTGAAELTVPVIPAEETTEPPAVLPSEAAPTAPDPPGPGASPAPWHADAPVLAETGAPRTAAWLLGALGLLAGGAALRSRRATAR